jgi:hypothetical protein
MGYFYNDSNGIIVNGLGAFKYRDVSGWGFAAVGVGFLANAWVFSSLKEDYKNKIDKIDVKKH